MGQFKYTRRRQILTSGIALCASLSLASCGAEGSQSAANEESGAVDSSTSESVPTLTPRIHHVYPFDETSFTQGLEVAPDGTLMVSTGQEGESRVYRRTIEGEELQSEDLDPDYFGEGITLVDDHLWQLTWQDGVAIKRDADSLAQVGTANYEGEGWGLCEAQDQIIFSDGSSELRRIDPDTLDEIERFEVTREGEPVEGLNELECVGDEIYANVFLSTDIVRIDAETGEVTAVIDASGLPNNAAEDPDNVLNGIAFNPETETFLLAGKRWPDLYEVTFEPVDATN